MLRILTILTVIYIYIYKKMMLVPLDGCFVGNTQESVSELLNHLMRLNSGLLVCIHSHLCSVLVFHFCFWLHKKMWKHNANVFVQLVLYCQLHSVAKEEFI